MKNNITGDRLDNIIDWDLYYMEQWIRNKPGLLQHLVQTTITPKITKMIIIGTNPDKSTNYLKELIINGK